MAHQLRRIALATMAALSAAQVSAQDAPTALFALSAGTNLERSENFKRAESSFALPVGGDFGVQADLAISKFQTADTITPSGALHLTYAVDPVTSAGLFAMGETPGDDSVIGIGIEALRDDGALRIDGYGMLTAAANDDAEGWRAGVDMAYRFGSDGQFAATGGYHRDNFDDLTRSYAHVGGRWAASDAVTLTVQYGQTDQGDGFAGFGVELMTSGGGQVFGRRDSFAGLPGY